MEKRFEWLKFVLGTTTALLFIVGARLLALEAQYLPVLRPALSMLGPIAEAVSTVFLWAVLIAWFARAVRRTRTPTQTPNPLAVTRLNDGHSGEESLDRQFERLELVLGSNAALGLILVGYLLPLDAPHFPIARSAFSGLGAAAEATGSLFIWGMTIMWAARAVRGTRPPTLTP